MFENRVEDMDDAALMMRWNDLAGARSPDLQAEASRAVAELRRRALVQGRTIDVDGLDKIGSNLSLSLRIDLVAGLPRRYQRNALMNIGSPYSLFSREEVAQAIDAAEAGMGFADRLFSRLFGSPFAGARRVLASLCQQSNQEAAA